MKTNQEIMQEYIALNNNDDKFNFFRAWDSDMDIELAEFFMSVAENQSEYDLVRIEAVKALIYNVNYDDSKIKPRIMQLIQTEMDEEYIQSYAMGTLEFMNVGDIEIAFAESVIQQNYDEMVQEGAFALIQRHKHLPSAKQALVNMLDNKEFGYSAKQVLSNK